MNITEYFEELISDYEQCYRQQFHSDIRLVEECILMLEKHCFVLNALSGNVENEVKDKLDEMHIMVWALHSTLETLYVSIFKYFYYLVLEKL